MRILAAAGLSCLLSAGVAGAQSSSALGTSLENAGAQAAADISRARAAAKATASPRRRPENLRPIDALSEDAVGLAARFEPITEDGRTFEMQATPVTQLQYLLVTIQSGRTGVNGPNPSKFKTDCGKDFLSYYGVALCADYPVEHVSWDDAKAFADALNTLQKDYDYRLPTEVEWEYAARGGRFKIFPYFFGFNETGLLDRYAWFKDNSGDRTHPVATKQPNPFHLYDIYGNVNQWATPPSGDAHPYRGGSYADPAEALGSAVRREETVGEDIAVGFRLVRTKRGGVQ